MRTWSPSIDFYETLDAFVLEADLPGVKAEDFHVKVDGNDLVVQGCRAVELSRSDGRFHTMERCAGEFMRRIGLPESVDEEGIHVQFNDGVLQLVIPKGKTLKEAKAFRRPRGAKEENMDTNEGITYWDKLRLRAIEVERTIKHPEKELQEVEENTEWVDRAAYESRVRLLDGLITLYRNEMEQIEKAHRRVEERSYGVCLACHEPIETYRLEIYPAAQFCSTAKIIAIGFKRFCAFRPHEPALQHYFRCSVSPPPTERHSRDAIF